MPTFLRSILPRRGAACGSPEQINRSGIAIQHGVYGKLFALFFLSSSCVYAQVENSSPIKTSTEKTVAGHQFLGWHLSYHNATVFLSKDRALLDNGICKFILTAQEPQKLIVYEQENKAYVQITPQKWFHDECGQAPSKYIRLSRPYKDKLFDIACTRYDCFNPKGTKVGLYWTTHALGIDPRLENAMAEFLGTPGNCGLPLKLEFHRTKYKYRYVKADAPRKKGLVYKVAGKTTLAEITPVPDIIPYCFLKTHKLSRRLVKEFVLPADAKRAKSVADLIYGEGGKITAGSVDLFMQSPMENQGKKPAK